MFSIVCFAGPTFSSLVVMESSSRKVICVPPDMDSDSDSGQWSPGFDDDDDDEYSFPCEFGGGGGKRSKKGRKKATKIFTDPACIAQREDQEAREKVSASKPDKVQRPIVKLSWIKECLACGHKFLLKNPSFEYCNVYRSLVIPKKYDPNITAIRKFIYNAREYRIIAADTEKKENPVFLILCDFEGNVLLFHDARNIPQELKEVLEDVTITKLQSNVVEDKQVLKKAGIDMKGLADTQVITGSFVSPGATNLGSKAQAQLLEVEVRGFNFRTMHFDKTPLSDVCKLHAISDGRVPLMILFRAAQHRAESMKVPLKPEENVFDLIVDVVNRVASVPARVVVNGRPAGQTIEQNWKTAKEFSPCPSSDINDMSTMKAILESQASWKPNYRPKNEAYNKNFRSEGAVKERNRKRNIRHHKKRAAAAANKNF